MPLFAVVVVGLFDPLCVTFLLIAQTTILQLHALRGVVKQCEFDTNKKKLFACYVPYGEARIL